jgi:hypothetical protein
MAQELNRLGSYVPRSPRFLEEQYAPDDDVVNARVSAHPSRETDDVAGKTAASAASREARLDSAGPA